jgi:hypothetical protein
MTLKEEIVCFVGTRLAQINLDRQVEKGSSTLKLLGAGALLAVAANCYNKGIKEGLKSLIS